MYLALLRCYNCNFELSANLVFCCREWTANFPIFGHMAMVSATQWIPSTLIPHSMSPLHGCGTASTIIHSNYNVTHHLLTTMEGIQILNTIRFRALLLTESTHQLSLPSSVVSLPADYVT